jgi:hypothetical protein
MENPLAGRKDVIGGRFILVASFMHPSSHPKMNLHFPKNGCRVRSSGINIQRRQHGLCLNNIQV